MNVILFDNHRENLFPLSYTRPISDFRVGILTIKEKWETYYSNVSFQTADYLLEKFPTVIEKDNLWIDASIFPNDDLIVEINSLRRGEMLTDGENILAINNHQFSMSGLDQIENHARYTKINDIWDIFLLNGAEIKNDFDRICGKDQLEWLGDSKRLKQIKESNVKIGNNPIYIAEGGRVNHSILNTTEGPIYIGKDAEIMEGSVVRGPFAMCNNAILKVGSKIYGSTTIGPYCKVGGEVENSIFFGYSSKAHNGFLGNSIIGEWCNIGAGTNNSNLKNNYSDIKLWNYQLDKFKQTGLQFCGLVLADHSKCGINTMFNTGTVVGVGVNLFGGGFTRTFIPSFSWGGSSGFKTYKLDKLFEVAEIVMKRRNIKFSNLDRLILSKVFEMTAKYRNY